MRTTQLFSSCFSSFYNNMGASLDKTCTDRTKAIRFVLIGRTGSGKSSTGNTILGENTFEVQFGPSSTTSKVSQRTSFVHGRHIEVVDTPGIFDPSDLWEEADFKDLGNTTCPHPHAILYTIPLGIRFTQETFKGFMWCKEFFSKDVLMLAFTGGDELKRAEIPIEKYIENVSANFEKVLEDCGRNYFVFDNTSSISSRIKQSRHLLETIESKLMLQPSVDKLSESLDDSRFTTPLPLACVPSRLKRLSQGGNEELVDVVN